MGVESGSGMRSVSAITEFNDDVNIALVPSGDGLLLDPSTFLANNLVEPSPTAGLSDGEQTP
jgi:hypothetical protein